MKLRTPRYLCHPPSIQLSYSDEINTEFILSYENVVAQQDYICGEIGAPTTIIQFRADANGEWERIDSQVSAISLRTSCDLLRRCIDNNGKLCRDCDSYNAELFHNLDKHKINMGVLKKRVDERRHHWEINKNNANYQLHMEQRHNRVFIYYNCPMLGYRELMFPIFYKNGIVGVFVVGQIKLIGQEVLIETSKMDFFKNNPNIFDEYLTDCQELDDAKSNPSKYTREAIMHYILHESHRGTKPTYPERYTMQNGLQIPEIKDQLSSEQYDEVIFKICKWLDSLETQLNLEMQRKYENHVQQVLNGALSDFYMGFIDVDEPLSVQRVLWDNVNKFVVAISNQCLLENMIVYGVNSVGTKEVSLLKLATSSRIFDNNIPTVFSLDKLPVDSMMYKLSNSKDTVELFDALTPSGYVIRNRMSVIFHPMKEILAASIAILIHYPDEALKSAIEDALIIGLQNFTALISSRLAVRFESAAQRHLEKTLRLYKHEMVNLSSGVSRAINDYLGNPKLKEIDDQKLEDVYRDASGTLDMFEFLSENIGILVNDLLPVKKKNTRFYQELLYKWENIRRVDARDKGCDFEFQKSNVYVYTDPRYAELVVYNLFTNAVKYAYDNSTIYIHFARTSPYDRYILSVTNFAFHIPESERDIIFEMGYRAKDAIEFYPDGSGIGLWIVQETMKHLGGKVELCKPMHVSRYNVPMLHAYMNNPSAYDIANEILFDAKKEYDRLLSEYITNDFGEKQNKIEWITSTYNWRTPTKSQLESELKKETYMIKFEVTFYV